MVRSADQYLDLKIAGLLDPELRGLDLLLSRPIDDSATVHSVFTWAALGWSSAVALAIGGHVEDATRAAKFSRDAAMAVVRRATDEDPYEFWAAWDIAFLATWLLTGEDEPDLMQQRVASYHVLLAAGLLDDPDIICGQVIRLMDIGDISSAAELLSSLHPQNGGPLTKQGVLSQAIDLLHGYGDGGELASSLPRLVSGLRDTGFRQGYFSLPVPWTRLHNRLFIGERDPWTVLGWLKSDPQKTFPTT